MNDAEIKDTMVEAKPYRPEVEADRKSDLEAEEESGDAMNADVPQPPDASKTTEGQPT